MELFTRHLRRTFCAILLAHFLAPFCVSEMAVETQPSPPGMGSPDPVWAQQALEETRPEIALKCIESETVKGV